MRDKELAAGAAHKHLRVIAGDGQAGESVLMDGAVMLRDFFTRRLPTLHPDDPWRPVIEDLACRCSALAGRRAAP